MNVLLKLVLRINAREIVRMIYAGILGRNPDEEGLEAYSNELIRSSQLARLLDDISGSREAWERNLYRHSPELVRLAFLGLLNREPEEEALDTFVAKLRESKDLPALLSDIGQSQEHWTNLLRAKKWRHPALSYGEDTWVFLHIEKTAGTSLQNMLVDSFGAKRVYREHADTLYLRSPAELSGYTIFAGHFNHDSLSYIPKRKLNLFTFVREPKKRLISLYNFWRAHEAAAPSYHVGMQRASEHDIGAFFQLEEIVNRPDIWNHMTWCIIGDRQWNTWRTLLQEAKNATRLQALKDIRQAIIDRLREFTFIGIQEDFARSCELLFRLFDRPQPTVRADHSLEQLSTAHCYIKMIKNPSTTSNVDTTLEQLVELDKIIYEEARNLYAERLA